MSIYIAECPLGVFAYDKDSNQVDKENFPNKKRRISERLLSIRESKPTEEHRKIIERLIKAGEKDFILESKKLASSLKDNFQEATFKNEIPNPAGKNLRSSLRKLAEKRGFDDGTSFLRDINSIITRRDLREKISKRDKIVIESINTIDELDKSINTLFEKVTEWYGIHFPELEREMSDHQKYLELISKLGRRESFKKENLEKLGMSEEIAKKIEQKSSESIGANFDELDIEALNTCVDRIRDLQSTREEIHEYLEGLMDEVAPNLKTLAGSLIGARLISLAGGLEDLAKMPSSTVQVLGAEKALFRSLKKGAKPPKHGVIFQHPEIRGSPQEIRGNIARALAGKLTIAARVDAMSGKFVGDKLEKEFEERVESIKKNR